MVEAVVVVSVSWSAGAAGMGIEAGVEVGSFSTIFLLVCLTILSC